MTFLRSRSLRKLVGPQALGFFMRLSPSPPALPLPPFAVPTMVIVVNKTPKSSFPLVLLRFLHQYPLEMSSAVHNLQKAILAGQKSLTQMLRETKLIAAKLNLEDVQQWVDFELHGYPQGVEPPKYRQFTTHHVEIRNPVRGWEFAGNFSEVMTASQPIADIENLSKGQMLSTPLQHNIPVRDSLGGSFGSDWPQRIITTGSQFQHIIEAVKNQLLQWTIELEKRGIRGEDMDFDEQEKQSATSLVFNIQKFTGVLGNVQDSQVTLYDYGSVNQLLIYHQIPKQDRRELEDIVDELKDAPPEKKPSLVARGEKWLLKHKELFGAAAEAVGKVIGAASKP